MLLLAIFLAKLLSPVLIVLGLLSGWFARTWWQVLVAAFVAASIDEAVLHAMQQARRFSPEIFIIGVIVAWVWGFAVFAIRQMRQSNA